MTVRPRACVIPGLLALSALTMTGCASSGTIGAAAAGGQLPGSVGSSTAIPPSTSAATGTSVPSSAGTDSSAPPAPATSAPASPTSQDSSALASSLKTLNDIWKDKGCKTALAGFSDYLYAQQASAAQGLAAIPGAVQKIRVGAQQTTAPGAAQVMNTMAADMLTMYSQGQQGKTPDKGPVKNDFQTMGNVCMPPP
jgi:hypothetical protein